MPTCCQYFIFVPLGLCNLKECDLVRQFLLLVPRDLLHDN